MEACVESWVAVPGYEGYYEVSDLGRVRSVDRQITTSNGLTRNHSSRILASSKGCSDKCVRVLLCRDGVPKSFSVAGLVLLAFDPEYKPGTDRLKRVDGDRFNNSLSNLKYKNKS